MGNKTKEQLAEEYAKNCNFENNYLAHISGYDSRQPEIDRLTSIISGKTFHDETEVLKTEIDALKEQIQTLTINLEHYKRIWQMNVMLFNYNLKFKDNEKDPK